MKRVYTFGNGKAEGRADMKNLLGGKGANLAEMNLIGVPVPPGSHVQRTQGRKDHDPGYAQHRGGRSGTGEPGSSKKLS